MKISENIKEIILNADGKALATIKGGEAHVVPVSTIKIDGEEIILVNYFFGQTLENIKNNSKIALSVWKGLEGYQIKGQAKHFVDGDRFEAIKKWVAEILPDRIVRGILVISPEEIFDVSATAEKPGSKVL